MTTTDTTDNSTDINYNSNNTTGTTEVFTEIYITDDSSPTGHCHNLNNNCGINDCNNNNFIIVLPNSECTGSPGLDCWNDYLPLDQAGPRLCPFGSPNEAASAAQPHQPPLPVGMERGGARGQLRDDGDWVESDTCPGME